MLAATSSPSALYQGPFPIRSRAFTPGWPDAVDTLRYARQVWSPAPSAFANAWQCASAPLSPPRSPPLPLPRLVTKNVITDFAPPICSDCATGGRAAGAFDDDSGGFSPLCEHAATIADTTNIYSRHRLLRM